MPDAQLSDAEWWTPAELARRWKSSQDTIRRQLKSGEIRAMKIGASFRIHRDEIARHESPAHPPEKKPVVTKPLTLKTSGAGLLTRVLKRIEEQKRPGGSLA